MPNHLTSLEQTRFDKLQSLTNAGIVCYPERFDRIDIADIQMKVASLIPASLTDITQSNSHTSLALAGRII